MNEQEITRASAGFQAIARRHNELRELLAKSATQAPVLRCEWDTDGTFGAVLFGRHVSVTPRPIFENGLLVFEELAFSVEWQGKPFVFLILNLKSDMGLYEQAADGSINGTAELFCWADNTYVSLNLFHTMAGKLFRSPVFAPGVLSS